MLSCPARLLSSPTGVTSPRIVVRGATLAITRRTTFRKAFLAPWDPRVEQAWLYALADAQRELQVAVHHGVRVITHHHLSITLTQPNLGEFLRRFHHDVSCAINTLLARERYDCPRNVFDARESHAMRLLDAAAQASHLTYEYLNPVAAGLVSRPEHMPGSPLDWGHWKAGGVWVKRPDFYFSKDRPEALWLEMTPPPLLMRAFDGDLDALIHHMRRLSEDGIRALRDVRGRPPLGAQRLRRLHPWAEPSTMAEPGGRRVPTFKIGAKGFLGRHQACQASVETTEWRKEHEVCRLERIAGRSVAFPYGTYGMRVFHGAQVAEPKPDAIVAQPGPLLHEVRAEIEQRKVRQTGRSTREQLLTEVRAAWTEEAAQIANAGDLEFATPSSSRTAEQSIASALSDDEESRPAPEVRHRFHREQDNGRPHARRLIIHRDRRRGRPKKNGKASSDPPS